MTKTLRFGVIGRSEWLYDTVGKLIADGHEAAFIVTAREAPEYARTSDDFRALAKTLDVPFLQTARLSSDEAQTFLDACEPADCVVSVNYSSLIGAEVINRYSLGVLNAHGGDLPRYRGNACQAWAILNAEPSIGLCIHRMVADEVDSGDIIARKRLPIDLTTKTGDVYRWFNTAIPELYCQSLRALANDPHYILERQSTDPSDALRCYPRRPEDGRIDWTAPTEDIIRLVNASGDPFAGAFGFVGSKRVHIFDAKPVNDPERFFAVPGQVLRIDQSTCRVDVAAGTGTVNLGDFRDYDGNSLSFGETFMSVRQRFTTHPGG